MKGVFWWWFRWAIGFNVSVVFASIGLKRAMIGAHPLLDTVAGVVFASSAIALAAVAITRIRKAVD